jgi:hypothetical protein
MNQGQASKNNKARSTLDQSSVDDEFVQNKIEQIYEQGAFRKKTIEIVAEYTDTVPFMKKVQEYADDQIDKRIFKNVSFVVGALIAWVASIIASYLAAKYL